MVKRKNKLHTDTKNVKWVGYCIECGKWRNNIHTLTNVVTGQHRCSMCASVMLILCPVCEGNGSIGYRGFESNAVETCHHCGGHKVVPQDIQGTPSSN